MTERTSDNSAAAGGYVVRWGIRSLLVEIVGILFVTVVIVATWPPPSRLVVLGFAVVLLALAVSGLRTIRRITKGTTRFAVDERGVYLGPDDDNRPASLVAWSDIEAIVHFRRVFYRGNTRMTQRYIGVRHDGATKARRIQSWRLDLERLTAAAQRYGGGTPVEQEPERSTEPGRS